MPQLYCNKPAAFLCLIGLFLLLSSLSTDRDFLTEQKTHARVKEAYIQKQQLLTTKLGKMGLTLNDLNILLVAYKTEQQLEVYVKKTTEKSYRKLDSYDICSMSGLLGPKLKSGDRQVPEGFYTIDRFNPSSAYYMSLGINYPNQVDLKRSGKANPGGDIFIHGKCVTVGCMPITDDYIKELYILAIQAYQNGQRQIPVYIFPFKFNSISADKFAEPYESNGQTIALWKVLKKAYTQFNINHRELNISIKDGRYNF